MGLMLSLVLLLGALINGFLDGFSLLNDMYIALLALTAGICFFLSKNNNKRVSIAAFRIEPNFVACILLFVVLIVVSKVMAPTNTFTTSAAINYSAQLIGLGASKEAGKILEKLYEKDPANPMVNLNLGVVYLKERKSDLVKKHLDAASQRLGFDENLWFNYGMLYYQLKDYKNAQVSFEKALALNPEMVSAAVYAGTMSFRLRELQKAIYYLENARFQRPGSPDILLHLGRAHMELMNFSLAKEAFDSALEMKPSETLVASIQEQLALLNEAEGGIKP